MDRLSFGKWRPWLLTWKLILFVWVWNKSPIIFTTAQPKLISFCNIPAQAAWLSFPPLEVVIASVKCFPQDLVTNLCHATWQGADATLWHRDNVTLRHVTRVQGVVTWQGRVTCLTDTGPYHEKCVTFSSNKYKATFIDKPTVTLSI